MSYTDSNANTQQAQNSVKTLNTIKKFVIFIVIAGCVVFGVQVGGKMKIENTLKLAETEYADACEDLEYSILENEYCKEAKINSIWFIVTDVEYTGDEYLVTLKADCSSTAYQGGMMSYLNNTLAAFEIIDQIPHDMTLSNGAKASIFNGTDWNLYVYVNGDCVYYPGISFS